MEGNLWQIFTLSNALNLGLYPTYPFSPKCSLFFILCIVRDREEGHFKNKSQEQDENSIDVTT
jgi:hypothetical protein